MIFKTKRFKEGLSLKEDFKKDFHEFLELPQEVAVSINGLYKNRETFPTDLRTAVKKIAEDTSHNAAKISLALSVIWFFASSLEKGEHIDDLLSDLFEGGHISEDEFQKAKDKAKYLNNAIELCKIKNYESRFERAGAPEFYGCSTSADLRFVFREELDFLTVQDEYTPHIENLIPMGLLELNIRKYSGEESFSCQLTLEELRMLIRTLRGLEKELILLSESAQKIREKGS